MDYTQIVEVELRKNKISLCSGQCNDYRSHKRGFVYSGEPVIHFDSKFATRSTLHTFFHELGHAVLNQKNLRSYEREAQAERFAFDKFKEYGIPVPRKTIASGKRYVSRKKRHGDRIKQTRQSN